MSREERVEAAMRDWATKVNAAIGDAVRIRRVEIIDGRPVLIRSKKNNRLTSRRLRQHDVR